MSERILVLGYFGFNNNQLDGQTIKTRNIYQLISDKLHDKVSRFDTQDFKYNKLSILRLLVELVKAKKLVYLPAHNNLKIVFPIIYFLSVLRGIDILYFVVGGWLPVYLENKKIHRKFLSRIKGVFTETKLMKKQLEEQYGFKNVDVFPNFRTFEFHRENSDNGTVFKMVFMSRINKMKGLGAIFALAEHFNALQLQKEVVIDFYGPIFAEDETYFLTQLKGFSFINYKGKLAPQDIHKTISEYDVLLLPTKYYTEGLPGAVVDAYIAGIPVIVSAWKHAHEFVKEGLTGFIFKWEDTTDFINAVERLRTDRVLLSKMKIAAFKERENYSAKHAWTQMENILEK